MIKNSRLYEFMILLMLVICGLYIRVYHLGDYFYSPDDVWHFIIASNPTIADVLTHNLRENVHPPLFYILLHFMMEISSNKLFLHSIVLLPAVLFIISSYYFGKTFKDKKCGLFLAMTATFAANMIMTSQGIREYMPMLFLLSLASISLLYFEKHKQRRFIFSYAILTSLAVLFHYSAIMVAACIGGIWFIKFAITRNLRSLLLSWIISNILIATCFFTSYYITFMSKEYGLKNYFSGEIDIIARIIPVIEQFSVFFNIESMGGFFILLLAAIGLTIDAKRWDFSMLAIFAVIFACLLEVLDFYPLTSGRHSLYLFLLTMPVMAFAFSAFCDFLWRNIVRVNKEFGQYQNIVGFVIAIVLITVTFAHAHSQNFYKSMAEHQEALVRNEDYNIFVTHIQNKVTDNDVIIMDKQAAWLVAHPNYHENIRQISKKTNLLNVHGKEAFFSTQTALENLRFSSIYDISDIIGDIEKHSKPTETSNIWFMSLGSPIDINVQKCIEQLADKNETIILRDYPDGFGGIIAPVTWNDIKEKFSAICLS